MSATERLIEMLINENDRFRELYKRHQDLDKQVEKANLGNIQLSDIDLSRLKKEKLLVKDQIEYLLNEYQRKQA